MEDLVLQRLGAIEKSIKQDDRPLTFTEATEYLSCSKSYLYKLTCKRLIPCAKPFGKKLYFRKSELENFLFRNPLMTKDQIDQKAVDYVTINKAGA